MTRARCTNARPCRPIQLLFASSDEFGKTDGLALLEGHITRLPDSVPLPHIGWNRLTGLERRHPLFEQVPEGSYAYFVHSFAPQGVAAEHCLARCRHGRDFAAVVGQGRVLGTQFHPEKSGPLGLRLLQNFLEVSRATAASA